MPIIVASSTSCSLIILMLISLVRKRDPRPGEVANRIPLVEEGDRVAQLVIERIETPSVVEVDVCAT
jgi:hypothetical protein